MWKTFLAFFLTLALVISSSPLKAADLETIQERGELIVGVKDNLRPLGFRDEEGNLQGFEIEIARRLAQEILGDEEALLLQPVTNAERLAVVYNDRVDLTIARVSVTKARSRLVDFSPYYYLDGTGFVSKDPSLQQLADLRNSKIAVLFGSSTIPLIKYNLPNAELVGVESYQEALVSLEAGEVNAFAGDRTVLTGWVQEYPQYHRLDVTLGGEALAVVLPRGLQYVSLRQKVSSAIALWRKSGWLEERARYWGLIS